MIFIYNYCVISKRLGPEPKEVEDEEAGGSSLTGHVSNLDGSLDELWTSSSIDGLPTRRRTYLSEVNY